MKGLRLQAYDQLIYTDLPDPGPCGDDDVLIAIRACGICGSDVAGMHGRTGRRIPPAVMGHECTGTIAQLGKNVTGFQIGDRVAVSASQFCGQCRMCRSGRTNMCESHKVLGISCNGYRLDGAYAEYVRLPAHTVFHLPDQVSFVEGTLLEPLANAVHAATSLSREALDEPVLVYGCGTIGLMVIQVLRAYRCATIIAVDQSADKLALAWEYGAHETLDATSEDVVARVRELTGGKGVRLSIECVGLGQTVRNALACTSEGGYLSIVGLLENEMSLPMQRIVTGEITLRGNFVYTREEFLESIRLLETKAVDMRGFISDTMPLEKGTEAFARLSSNSEQLVKVVLTV